MRDRPTLSISAQRTGGNDGKIRVLCITPARLPESGSRVTKLEKEVGKPEVGGRADLT
jgi:hypothetical protein